MPIPRPLPLRSFARLLFVHLVLLASLPRVASAQPAPYLFVPTQDGFSFVDPVTNTVTGTVTGVCSFTLAVASPDGRRVYCTTGGAMKVLDVGRRTLVTSIPLPFNVSDGTITPDGSSIWLADFGGQAVHVIDTTTNTIVANIPVGFLANGVAISPDGQRVFVVGNSSSAMTIIDVATRSVVGSIPLNASGEHIAVHPGGHKAYVTLYLSNRLSVVDLDTATEQTTVTFDQFPWDVAVSPDGSTVYVTGRDGSRLTGGTVRVLSTATNTVTTTIQGGGFPGSVRFTPDGSRAYVAYLNSSSTTTVIDTATNTMVGDIPTGYNPGVIAMGPPIIRGDCPCAPTVAFDDAALTALHFGKYVPMFGGTLTIRSTTTLNRTFSLLSVAGATPTQSILAVSSPFAVTIPGVMGEGTFVKDHNGKVSLAGDATQAGGTRVEGGTLQVFGQHPGLMTLLPDTVLQGTGPFGTIDGSAGGWIAPDTTMHAANVTFGANSQLLISDLDSPNYSRLDVTGTAAINGAGLYFSGVQSQNVVPGKAWSLLTHTTGAFAGEPEGFTFPINQELKFRYTYRGGSGSDLMLLVDSPPTLAPIGDRTIAQDGTLGPVPLTVTDDFTTAANMIITATSSNPALVPNANLVIGGGATRTLTATPLFGTSGQTTITVTVTDEAAWQVRQTFVLTVSPTRSYYLAEGATGGFFTTDILLANPNTVAAPITVSFHKDDGQVVSREMTLPATSRTTVRVNDLDGMASTAFSTTVVSTSGVPLVVERTMWWDVTGYGASTEKAGQQSALTWYFAEGAQGYFHTYFLLFNPNVTATVAHMTYLMEDGPPIQRDVPMPAGTRVTLDAGDQPELQNRAFGTRVLAGR